MSARLLIQTLKNLPGGVAVHRKLLAPTNNDLAVYYICALANLAGIAKNGILPNATAPKTRTDLSGQGVQVRREAKVLLYGNGDVSAHQCVNLFWNPLNGTFVAFQRNGVLRAISSKNEDDSVVCILEINLERLLFSPGCTWTIAPQNFAAGNFTRFTRGFLTGEECWPDGTPYCDWKSIFSAGPTVDRRLNMKRSAELIVHLGASADGVSSLALPFDLVSQIFIPAPDVRVLSPAQTSFLASLSKTITPLSTVNEVPIFLGKADLLKAEVSFIKSLRLRNKSDSNVLKKVSASLDAIMQFEQLHPELAPSRDRFANPDLAYGHHGSLHAARVMFWSAFLVQHLPEAQQQTLLPISLAAASLHDTRRLDDTEDELHGQTASVAHREALTRVFTDSSSLNACTNAIQHHCVPDHKCLRMDLALQILKDADALDRGRFGAPDQKGGCNTTLFRTTVLKTQDPYKNISWMAYFTARNSEYTPWGATPCTDFAKSLAEALAHASDLA